MQSTKWELYEYQRSRSVIDLGPDHLHSIFLNFFSSITADFNISSAIRWAIQDQWSSGFLIYPSEIRVVSTGENLLYARKICLLLIRHFAFCCVYIHLGFRALFGCYERKCYSTAMSRADSMYSSTTMTKVWKRQVLSAKPIRTPLSSVGKNCAHFKFQLWQKHWLSLLFWRQ